MGTPGTGRWGLRAAVAGLVLLFVAVTVQRIWSADFWWQLKNGQWIVQNHAVPRQEMFSFTARGAPIREMRWLYCAAIYVLWEHAGAWLLVLLQALAVLGTFALLMWDVGCRISDVKRGGRACAAVTPLGLLIVGLALAAGFNRWVMRPELVTYVMIAAFLAILERGERRSGWGGVWALPLLQVLWVNTHTQFVFGPVLAWLFAGTGLVRILTQRRGGAEGVQSSGVASSLRLFVSSSLVPALLVTAACWVNPYGHGGAMYALQVWQESGSEHATARVIMEMRSPFAMPMSAWGWDLYAAAVLVLVAAATFVPVWRSEPLSRLAVFAIGAYLFTMLQRNTGLAAVMCCWVGLSNLGMWDTEEEADTSPSLRQRAASLFLPTAVAGSLLGFLFAAAGWYVATDRYSVRNDLPREFGLGVVEWYQPRGAADFIRENQPPGNLFNVMRDGSYFVWSVSDVLPVFIDGRTDAYGPELLDQLAKVNGSSWEEFARKFKINTAVIPNRGYGDVVQAMLKSQDWALVELDSDSLVFVRRIPENVGLTTNMRDLTAVAPSNHRDAVPRWKAVYGGVGRAWYSMGMADSLLSVGAVGDAERCLEAAIAEAPGLKRARAALAPMYLLEGKAREADELVRGLSAAEHAEVDVNSARLLMGAGKLKEAVAPAERALAANPTDDQLRIVVADLHFQTGEFAKARDEYALALQHGAGSVNEINKLAGACEQLRDFKGAVTAYQRSLAIDQSQYMVWNMMGADCAQAGDYKSAGSCFENSLKIKPDYGPAQRNLEKLRAIQK